MPEPIQRKKIATVDIGEGANWRDLVNNHEKIMGALEDAASNRLCASVDSIASYTGLNADLVKNHLQLMQIDQGGKFMDRDNTMFCIQPGLILAVEKLRELGK